MCDHRLWPDIASVVCQRTDPHPPGAGCHYVTDQPTADGTTPPAARLTPWPPPWVGIAV